MRATPAAVAREQSGQIAATVIKNNNPPRPMCQSPLRPIRHPRQRRNHRRNCEREIGDLAAKVARPPNQNRPKAHQSRQAITFPKPTRLKRMTRHIPTPPPDVHHQSRRHCGCACEVGQSDMSGSLATARPPSHHITKSPPIPTKAFIKRDYLPLTGKLRGVAGWRIFQAHSF